MLTPRYSSSQTSAPAVQAPRYPPQASRDSYRNSGYGRPASSIYSQPSPAAATFAAQQLRDDVYGGPHEVSPPSSPDELTPRHGSRPYDRGDVSPIEEPDNSLYIMDRAPPSQPDHGASSIPMMRRERRKHSDAAMRALQESKSRERLRQPRPHGSDVRWDPSTGEPTTSNKGRPSQINPHHYVKDLSSAKAPTGAPRATGQQPISPFGVRLKPAQRKTAERPEPEPAPRPEWRGGSGRTALVAPVNDKNDVTPLNIPRRSSKRVARGPGVLSPVSSLDSETASPPPHRGAPMGVDENRSPQGTIRNVVPSAQHVPAKTDNDFSTQSSYPSPPLSDGRPVPNRTTPQQPPRKPVQAPPPPTHLPSPQSLYPPNEKAIRRKPPTGPSHNPQISTSSSVYSQQDVPSAPAPRADDWAQPPSRFSVTTYATSAHTESPRPSVDDDAPPLPTPPRQFTESPKPAPGSSVLDRKRPVVKGYEEAPKSPAPPQPIKINMDSPYYVPANPRSRPSGPRPVPYGNHSTLSVASVSSADKILPLAPPEETARDRVTQLNAKLEALGNRRININQAIKQMTELMPTDNILASEAVIRKREAEKRKVEVLKTELADVQREEYELGLKLHRAYKRLDRDAEYEPTGLWVRRVTG
ncbi:hypothetical protein JX265_008934 [Neoarthrinium moseri]|uniref:Uncharacterized protein n=1 Tax=Neoarthrinium moseri TaxID=1658444 RepID=A0A9P9WGR0_9PEZI|nr:hypothetical protein JX266_007334 [Neoarthrinium moseri]KAI1862888.1 hypothetical protein JX265_008934 [Neoarthrinium moseri]